MVAGAILRTQEPRECLSELDFRRAGARPNPFLSNQNSFALEAPLARILDIQTAPRCRGGDEPMVAEAIGKPQERRTCGKKRAQNKTECVIKRKV